MTPLPLIECFVLSLTLTIMDGPLLLLVILFFFTSIYNIFILLHENNLYLMIVLITLPVTATITIISLYSFTV